jgi:hypothetical protein
MCAINLEQFFHIFYTYLSPADLIERDLVSHQFVNHKDFVYYFVFKKTLCLTSLCLNYTP